MSERVNWEEFDKLHVIRSLKQLVGRWWNIQLNFTDEKGFLRGVPEGKFFNPLNPISKYIVQDQTGFKHCLSTARKTSVEATTAKKPKISKCHHTGFSTISVPIRVGKKYLGCAFGDGFLLEDTAGEQKVAIRGYMKRHFPKQEKILDEIDKLPVLSKKEVTYLTELISMVVDEILLAHSSLSRAEEKVDQLKTELGERYGFDQMIGKSGPMQAMYHLLERVCDTDSTVLVQGENGTGKELIAKALHYNSSRRKQKFLVVNCGAFNENLLESELFGHVKGAFTGAIKDKKGLFEAATKGTLFLDEIGDTSMAMQVKLLRILQEGTFTPVGSTEVRKSAARIVAATNKNLEAMVKEGTFREDLYYRLNVINIIVPPLRDRKEDINLLCDHFLESYSKESKTSMKQVSSECMEKLLNYEWPGNVRELENEIERLCVLSGKGSELSADFLSTRIKESTGPKYPGYRVDGKLKDAIEDLEKQMILEGLRRTRWNKSKLSKELGISRASLIMKVDKYDLEKRTV